MKNLYAKNDLSVGNYPSDSDNEWSEWINDEEETNSESHSSQKQPNDQKFEPKENNTESSERAVKIINVDEQVREQWK